MQSNGGRALVAALAVVILVGGFFLLTGEEEAGEGSGDTANSTTTEATTTEGQPAGEDDGRPAEEKPKPEPESDEVLIVTEGGAPVDGVTELEFDAGDEIRFAVESDIPEEVHVHGYDIEQALEPGETTEFAFPADLDGIFEVELHGSATQIAELTVNP